MDPLDFLEGDELKAFARRWRARAIASENAAHEAGASDWVVNAEDGSEKRFTIIFRAHLGWWLVHNLVAHPLIGILPVRVFFDFHDWTSRKMRGAK